MTETPLFFEGSAAALFGVLHEPEEPAGMPFVFCHPFGEEKLWTHRVFVAFARELAARGHAVLRFDYMGNGDSGGDFSESSLESALADINRAMDLLQARSQAPRIGLLGLRLGASLAAAVAEDSDRTDALVLWAPVVNGGRYLQELLRVNLTTQMAVYREIRDDRDALTRQLADGRTVNVDGYEIAPEMANQLAGLNLLASPKRFQGRCLIVQIDRGSQGVPAAELKALRDSYPHAELTCAQEEPFWKEILRFYEEAPQLFARTLPWLEPSRS